MKKIIKMRNIIGILALTMITSACNRDTGYFCKVKMDGINKDCKKGDLTIFRNSDDYSKYCKIEPLKYKRDFRGDNFVCIYRGEQRIER